MKIKKFLMATLLLPLFFAAQSCEKTNDPIDDDHPTAGNPSAPVFLVIDEESIDNGNEPNNFSETDVNDQLARVGLRTQLNYFKP